MENKIYSKVFTWLFIGLLVTFGSGYILSLYPNAVINIMGGTGYIIAIVIELAVALLFGFRITKMSKNTAIFCYLLYSLVTGVTFSTIFLAFELTSLMMVFGITAVVFGVFAFFGMVTKLPLYKISSFLLMGLIAIILASLINLFIGSSSLDFGICIIGVAIFIGYIAYDMKMLPTLYNQIGEEKGAIYGAFQLYLDFINLFIRLLQLFGNSDND